MTLATKTVVFNVVPLFASGCAYAAVSAYVAPLVWRLRGRATAADLTIAVAFPAVAALAFLYGAVALANLRPLGGDLWTTCAAALISLAPPTFFFARLARTGIVSGGERMHAAEERTSRLDRGLAVVRDLSQALDAAETVEEVAQRLIDRAVDVVGFEFGSLLTVDAEKTEAQGVLARRGRVDLPWFRDVRLDLVNDPSGTASAVFEGAPVAVYDADSSQLVNKELRDRTGARSYVFVPLVAEGRVVAVLSLASLATRQTPTSDELSLLQSLANEAALAVARVRSSSALAVALERERLVARISAKFRTQLDLDAILRVALEETAQALGASRAFIRLGPRANELPIAAQWQLPALEPLAVADVDLLLEDGSDAVLATPIVVFEELVGIFALHREEAGPWSETDVVVAEAVAREAGIALHIARLLAENAERLRQQDALLGAAQAVTAELELDRVLQRLVDEVAALLNAEAADLFLFDRAHEVFRCSAVHGLPDELVGFEFTPDRGLAAEAVERGVPVISADYTALDEPVPHAAYEGFTDAMVAPVTWHGETRGVIGVGGHGGRTFAARDADILDAFASLAALAIRNAEIFDERTRQARVQQGFTRIASVLGESLSLAGTLDATAQAATEAIDAAFAAVLMPDAEGTLTLAGEYELPPTLRDVRLPDVLELCARERRLVASPFVADDGRFDGAWKELARAAGFAALIAVPLETPRADRCGVVLVGFAEPRRFSDEDLELAERLAGAARGAIERSELFEAERAARALAQELARTGSLLATELDPDAVLDEVVQRAPLLVGADACAVRVVDGEELVVTAATEDVVGARSPASGWLSGDVLQSRRPLALADATSGPRHLEHDAVLASGYASYLGVPLVGPEGTVHGVLSLYTKRPRSWRHEEIDAIAALAASTAAALSNAELYTSVALDRERSAAILGNVADGIVAVDRDSHVVLWNPAAERITGVAASEATGRTVVEVLQRELESDGEEAGRLMSIMRGTEEVWLSVSEAVMRDPTGAVAGRIFAFRDISADRLVEEMKSEFVATVSHELRGPLTSIYGFAETLLRQDVDFGEQERNTFLTYIASESERLTSIVDALLNVARLDTGDLQVAIAPVDVRNVAADVVSTFEESSAVEHSFVLDLPSEPLSANADRDKLRQVIAVLVDNAVKFSPGGATVTVGVRRTDEGVEVSVEDEGIGIPQSEQERIFRKFYRASDAPHGTGVGLFIAHGLVSAMRGGIRVQSAEGRGSVFAFTLPSAVPAVVQEERPRV